MGLSTSHAHHAYICPGDGASQNGCDIGCKVTFEILLSNRLAAALGLQEHCGTGPDHRHCDRAPQHLTGAGQPARQLRWRFPGGLDSWPKDVQHGCRQRCTQVRQAHRRDSDGFRAVSCRIFDGLVKDDVARHMVPAACMQSLCNVVLPAAGSCMRVERASEPGGECVRSVQ